eukprot:COSAG01_NODE_46555_length_399_cov_0.800000_1_plen_92_part_01
MCSSAVASINWRRSNGYRGGCGNVWIVLEPVFACKHVVATRRGEPHLRGIWRVAACLVYCQNGSGADVPPGVVWRRPHCVGTTRVIPVYGHF